MDFEIQNNVAEKQEKPISFVEKRINAYLDIKNQVKDNLINNNFTIDDISDVMHIFTELQEKAVHGDDIVKEFYQKIDEKFGNTDKGFQIINEISTIKVDGVETDLDTALRTLSFSFGNIRSKIKNYEQNDENPDDFLKATLDN